MSHLPFCFYSLIYRYRFKNYYFELEKLLRCKGNFSFKPIFFLFQSNSPVLCYAIISKFSLRYTECFLSYFKKYVSVDIYYNFEGVNNQNDDNNIYHYLSFRILFLKHQLCLYYCVSSAYYMVHTTLNDKICFAYTHIIKTN